MLRREAFNRDTVLAWRTAQFCLLGFNKGLPPVRRFLLLEDHEKHQPQQEMLQQLEMFSAHHGLPIRHVSDQEITH